ncbi:MAG: Tol-Pal system beta propeller repeat protein TolB [Candidatus Binatia bacterium]
MKRSWTRAGLALVVLLVGRTASAVVTGAIYGPGSAAFPIAVLPLKNLGGDVGGAAGGRFAAALSRDLDLSGYFRLVDPKTFVEDAEKTGLTAGETDFIGWAAIGAQAVVKGGVTVAGDGVTVEVRLFDVAGRKDVPQVGRRFSGARADLPRMAHKVADAILEFLTGERGPFDSQIVLVSNRAGKLTKDLYVWSFDRDEPARVTDERSIVVGPRWRPDARRALFVSYREHTPRLFEVEVATKRVGKLFAAPGAYLGGAWSPDGAQLLVTREEAGNPDIDLVDRAGQVLRHLTEHWGVDVSPAWAPDGRRFAFCSARSGSPQIYVMNVDGGGLERVSFTGNYNTSPSWSPKGDRLAWSTRAGGGFQVVVATASGSGAQTITSAGSNEDPSWSPDGRYVVFSSTRAGRHHLVLADRDGKTQKELTRGAADDTSPAWSPRLE